MSCRASLVIVLTALAALFATGAPAQSSALSPSAVEPLRVGDALGTVGFPAYVPLQLSPDGQRVAYTVVDGRKRILAGEDYTLISARGVPVSVVGGDVWIADTRTGEARNLSEGKGSSWGAIWSPDGSHLAFFSDRSGSVRVYLWSRVDGTLRQVSDASAVLFFDFENVQWAPDGRALLVKLLPSGVALDQHLARGAYRSPAESTVSGVDSATVTVYRSRAAAGQRREQRECAGNTAISGLRWHAGDIALMDVTSGAIRRLVHNVPSPASWFSPDGRRLAYMRVRHPDNCASAQAMYDLHVVSIADGHDRMVARGIPQYMPLPVSWSPDGTRLAYTTAPHPQITVGSLPSRDLYVVSVTGGAPRNLTPGTHAPLGSSDYPPVWDPSSRHLYVLGADTLWRVDAARGGLESAAVVPGRNLRAIVGRSRSGRFWAPDPEPSLYMRTQEPESRRVGIARVDLASGTTRLLWEDEQSFSPFPWGLDAVGGSVVYLAESASTPPDIWIAKPGFQDRRRLTRINPQLDRYVFGESRLVRWLGTDGQPLSGALYLPAGYQAGKQYPLIVGVYGGSTPSTRVHRFGSLGASLENQQLYATRGYAMLLPDMPLRLGTPMQDIAGTVLPGINRVIELGIADPARVGVIGGSYGGYSALALLVQSHRFAAAVAVASPANLFSYYAQLPREGEPNVSWLETGQGRMGGDPWELRSRYVENSPFFYLDRIKTPVLLVHGTADVAVPVMESDAVYVALWRLGKEVEYARYVGEGHGGWSRINSLDYVQRTLAWFERYLKPIAAQSGGNETAGRTARGR